MTEIDPEVFIKAATRHGEDSETDHEVGDLQDYFRTAFKLLSPEQAAIFLSDPTVLNALETSCPGSLWGGESPMQAYINVASEIANDEILTHGR